MISAAVIASLEITSINAGQAGDYRWTHGQLLLLEDMGIDTSNFKMYPGSKQVLLRHEN